MPPIKFFCFSFFAKKKKQHKIVYFYVSPSVSLTNFFKFYYFFLVFFFFQTIKRKWNIMCPCMNVTISIEFSLFIYLFISSVESHWKEYNLLKKLTKIMFKRITLQWTSVASQLPLGLFVFNWDSITLQCPIYCVITTLQSGFHPSFSHYLYYIHNYWYWWI